jgi:hypothetical protein
LVCFLIFSLDAGVVLLSPSGSAFQSKPCHHRSGNSFLFTLVLHGSWTLISPPVAHAGDLGFPDRFLLAGLSVACSVSYSFSCSDFLVSTEGFFYRSIRFSLHFGVDFPGCIAARVFTAASSLLPFFISRGRRSFRGLIRARRDSPDPALAAGARPHCARSRFHSFAACLSWSLVVTALESRFIRSSVLSNAQHLVIFPE